MHTKNTQHARYHAKNVTKSVLSNPPLNPMRSCLTIPIWQKQQLRHREVKLPACGCTACEDGSVLCRLVQESLATMAAKLLKSGSFKELNFNLYLILINLTLVTHAQWLPDRRVWVYHIYRPHRGPCLMLASTWFALDMKSGQNLHQGQRGCAIYRA